MNQHPEDLDVAVVTAYTMEILLIVLAWRIIKTCSRFSHKPYSCTLFLAGNFKLIMHQLGKASVQGQTVDQYFDNL